MYQKDQLIEQEAINILWRSEAIWLLLWSIHKVDQLKLPMVHVEVSEIMARIPEFFADPKDFIETAVVRSVTEILDASDLIYRLHWATRNAGLITNQCQRNWMRVWLWKGTTPSIGLPFMRKNGMILLRIRKVVRLLFARFNFVELRFPQTS